MAAFLDALHSGRVLLMDGAMGTELRRAGLPDDGCGEVWNVTHPERVCAVHQAYVDAGADVFLTNTFQANFPALVRCLGPRAGLSCDYITPGIQLLVPFTSETRFALASIGPIMEPPDMREFPPLWQVSGMATTIGRGRAISGVLIETCSTPRVRFAVRRMLGADLPVLLSLTYLHDPKGKIVASSGHAPEWFARRAKNWGVAALGVNCGRDIDMSDMIEIIKRYRQETDLPLFARPNAGTPTKRDGRWVWPHTPERMAARLPELLDAGACMVGGCCGTTPEHIAAFRRVVDQYNGSISHAATKRYGPWNSSAVRVVPR